MRPSLLPRFRNDLERTIADAEMNTYHWTLMHRYHKTADIINEVCSRAWCDVAAAGARSWCGMAWRSLVLLREA